ncbi:MAG: putative quinol monooxygenase [Terriglobales bacterium]
MLVLLVQFVVKPGTEQQARKFMREMEENTRREPGCRLYIGSQSTQDPRRFCFYEMYDDQAALDQHRAAPYFAEFVTNGLGKLMESSVRELFRPVEDQD